MTYYKNQFRLAMLFTLLCAFTISNAQQKYTIQGKIEGLATDVKVHLAYRVGKTAFVNDSTLTKNGKFNFDGTTARPVKVSLWFSPVKPDHDFKSDSRSFYLSAGTTSITGKNLQTAVIKGGKTQDDYMELGEEKSPSQEFYSQYKTKNTADGKPDTAAMHAAYRAFVSNREELTRQFITKHNSSYVSLDLVGDRAFLITEPDQFEKLYNQLSPGMKNTAEGKKYAELLYLAKRLAVGQPAIDFTQNDPDGKPISLASFKGKYVLVDFWASWCGPCRAEYPYLKKAYQQFKDKNFDIIGVSLDTKSPDWTKSIKDNGFPWHQVCDLKGFNNEVAVAYGVYAIPRSFLIDPNGIIIAEDLRNDNLIRKLEEVIKN